MASIALTGASGTLGRHVADALAAAGHDVLTLGRTEVGTRFQATDLADATALAARLAGVDWLVHAAGVTGDRDHSENVVMAAAIATAAQRSGTKVVNLSTVAVYGSGASGIVDEDASCVPATEYGTSKLAAERLLDAAGATVVHLRVGVVFDQEAFDRFAAGRARPFVKGNEVTNFVFGPDVGHVVAFVVGHPPPGRRTVFNVVRPEVGESTYKELLGSLGLRRRPRALPPVVAHLARRARGVASLPGTAVYSSAALEASGFVFAPMAEVTPPAWKQGPAAISPDTGLDGLRILHAAVSVDREQGSGTAVRTLDVARQMARRGAHSSVVSLDPDAERIIGYESRGVTHTVLPSTRRYRVPTRGLSTIRQLVARHDVIHLIGYWSPLNVVLTMVARRQRTPYVICPAGSLEIWGRSKRLKKIFHLLIGRRMLHGASGWIAIVEDECAAFEANGIPRDQVTLIPNGVEACVDPAAIDPAEPAHRGLLSTPYVLYLGRLHSIKGPDLLLDAFIRVADLVPFDLVLAGPDGGLLPELKRAALMSGCADRIHFVGFVDGSVKQQLIARAQALVIPSRREAMSIVVVEAAMSRRPAIVTTQCGLNALLSEETGGVVRPDAQDIAVGLVALGEMDLDRAGDELHRRVAGAYDWNNLAGRYGDLYGRILAGPGEVTRQVADSSVA